MFKRVILSALASAALIPAAAIAQHGGGGGGMGGGMGMGGGIGMHGGMGGGIGMGGGLGSGGMGMGGISDMGSMMRDQGRLNSQALSHASQTGIDHANQNSVLAGTSSTTSVRSGAFAGLSTGMTIYSNGTAVGTVDQIRTTGNGSVAMVVVKGTNGGLYAVPASKLSLSGGTLSTTSRFNGINSSTSMAAQARVNSQGPLHASATGIAHANAHSVLAGGSTTSLTGVSVGMPLYSNGAQVGTVYRVVTANGVVTRVLVQGSNGQMYSLAPNTLTASGGTLTTSAKLRGM